MKHLAFACAALLGLAADALAHDGPHDEAGMPLRQLIGLGLLVLGASAGLALILRRYARARRTGDSDDGSRPGR